LINLRRSTLKLPILAKFALAVAPFLVATPSFAIAPTGVGTFACGAANYSISSFDLEVTATGGKVTVGVPLTTVASSSGYLGVQIGSCTLTPTGAISDSLGGTTFSFSGVTIAADGAYTSGGVLYGTITFTFTGITTYEVP
jgi:hypothetical protein